MKKAPTPEEFANHLKKLSTQFSLDGDYETTHVLMDEYLCQTLSKLGYSEGIKIFRTTPKWYA